jgi:hypothetical protein
MFLSARKTLERTSTVLCKAGVAESDVDRGTQGGHEAPAFLRVESGARLGELDQSFVSALPCWERTASRHIGIAHSLSPQASSITLRDARVASSTFPVTRLEGESAKVRVRLEEPAGV